ncbi:alpha/beta fold hydrolase [Streptomyces sp. NPDC004270]
MAIAAISEVMPSLYCSISPKSGTLGKFRCCARAGNPAAALNHDLAGRRFDDDRRVPLTAVTAPTLVMHGSADPLFPPAHGEAFAARIPGARLEVIPGMGHHPLFAPGLTQRIADSIIRYTT